MLDRVLAILACMVTLVSLSAVMVLVLRSIVMASSGVTINSGLAMASLSV